MNDLLRHLPVLVLTTALALFVVLAARRRRRLEREALAAKWVWLLREQEARRSTGARLLQVLSVHQRARRGSKASIRWYAGGAVQDAWFDGWHVPPGAFVLVTGNVGRGARNRIRNVLYVEPGHVHGWVPASAPGAWHRQQALRAPMLGRW
jgi:hypothetical protein